MRIALLRLSGVWNKARGAVFFFLNAKTKLFLIVSHAVRGACLPRKGRDASFSLRELSS